MRYCIFFNCIHQWFPIVFQLNQMSDSRLACKHAKLPFYNYQDQKYQGGYHLYWHSHWRKSQNMSPDKSQELFRQKSWEKFSVLYFESDRI